MDSDFWESLYENKIKTYPEFFLGYWLCLSPPAVNRGLNACVWSIGMYCFFIQGVPHLVASVQG